MRFNLPCCV